MENQRGFSMLELLVSVVITGIVFAGTTALFSSQFGSARNAASRNAIESAIANDLNWIRTYARLWKMATGPYNVTATQTTAGTFTSSPLISYDPGTSNCSSGLASAFITSAATVALSPARPNDIPTTSGTVQSITIPGSVTGVTLNRSITFSSGADANRISVYYALSGTNATSLGISRESSVYIDAYSWCPTP
ncbi:type II secretion system protein [Synechococcus sp. BA-132 BA5]|uniref:type II secretion system protein n=1 Tax=Synechococcus sp. BA-132 BA5 TaxID=3110252 RepID=UPI002B20D596|nr:type II secretion system protein [Synechococcus sp. BA-132 BA5]MEA5415418.1 type II secretion system protein [Synechococcus sp. BA-132 BA5]